MATKQNGLSIPRYFTKDIPADKVYDAISWERRDVPLLNKTSQLITTEQKDVEVPTFWSDRALTVVVDKYFRGQYNTLERETSVWQMVCRVADTITDWGRGLGYFRTNSDAINFSDELKYLLVTQRLCFNSPVWFNVGWNAKPQVSACFLLDVEDDMNDIMEHMHTEINVFRAGSGTGVNISKLRAKGEPLSRGGASSGALSFNRIWDNAAGVVQSGGSTRRAARMVWMDADHPEILDFINCKKKEEEKAFALRDAGFDTSWGSEVVELLQWQNANLTVRVSDQFMRLALEAEPSAARWETKYRVSGDVASSHRATDILQEICEADWRCGDPGLAFDSALQKWHTCPECGPIRTSNPCGEFVHNINTSCNLLTENLLKFLDESAAFNVNAFAACTRIAVYAQDILISKAGYPHPEIERETLKHRPIGLNYANLGAMLMSLGLSYDSDEGRQLAAAITSLMTAHAAIATAELAEVLGPFECYAKNKHSYLRVMEMHYAKTSELARTAITSSKASVLAQIAEITWRAALDLLNECGARNSQLTLLAPTGTVSFMLDCDSTGIEPLLNIVTYKSLVGGGTLKMICSVVEPTLLRLGYDNATAGIIVDQMRNGVAPVNIPELLTNHLSVFDTALDQGDRSLHVNAHIDMMIAVQPFLSGAISKTVNLPESATPEDFRQAYIRAWKGGLKCVAVYRDGSKVTQPVVTRKTEKAIASVVEKNGRRKLPSTRNSLTHKFSINGHEGYLTIGLYDDGQPGELFVVMSKEGTIISGLMDSFATSISLNLQYGVPLAVLIRKFTGTRFEPYGFTENAEIQQTTSIVDYIFRFLEHRFLTDQPQTPPVALMTYPTTGNVCPSCGSLLRQTKANCFQCDNCSSSYGGCG